MSNPKRNWAKFGVGVKLIVILRHIIAYFSVNIRLHSQNVSSDSRKWLIKHLFPRSSCKKQINKQNSYLLTWSGMQVFPRYSKIINAVKRQRNLGLVFPAPHFKLLDQTHRPALRSDSGMPGYPSYLIYWGCSLYTVYKLTRQKMFGLVHI